MRAAVNLSTLANKCRGIGENMSILKVTPIAN
jgi:hypothetical protein